MEEVERWPDTWLRAEVLKRDGYQCTKCGSAGPRLALHHREHVIGRRKMVNTTPDDVVTLCMSCHIKAHREELRSNPRRFVCQSCRAERFSPSYLGLIKCPHCGGKMHGEQTDNVRVVQ